MSSSENLALLETILNLQKDTSSNADKMEKKEQLLLKVYGHAPIPLIVNETDNLPSEENFDICKAEMLRLLDYIIDLGKQGNLKNKYAIFEKLKKNIDFNLLRFERWNSKPEDISVILINTRATIENALVNIERFAQTSNQLHDNYQVHGCFQGANNNIEDLVSDFFTDKSLNNDVLAARKKLIRQLATEFVAKQGLARGIWQGEQIHIVNFFYNQFAKEYNIPEITDAVVDGYGGYFDRYIPLAKDYIKKQLSVKSLIEVMIADHPLPDLESVSIPVAWERVEEQKRLIGAFFSDFEAIHHDVSDEDYFYYAKFYDEHSEFDDDLPETREEDKGTWIRPKDKIMDYYRCYFAERLIKENLIPENTFYKKGIVGNDGKTLNLLYNGTKWFVEEPATFNKDNRTVTSRYYRPLTSLELESENVQRVIIDSLSTTDELIDFITIGLWIAMIKLRTKM